MTNLFRDWVARTWRLHPESLADRDFLNMEVECFNALMFGFRPAPVDWFVVGQSLTRMYKQLHLYRRLRGVVHADDVLDRWLDIGMDLVRGGANGAM